VLGESVMLFFGHRFIESEHFYHISNIDAILNTPSNSVIYLEFGEDNLDIIRYANDNGIKIALYVESIKDILYASSLNATYIVIPNELAKTAQNLADTYLFDAKILVSVSDDSEIEELAVIGVDGVLYPNGVIKISS
jgi:hypothetical protein